MPPRRGKRKRIQAPEAKCVSGNRISEPHCSHGCLGQNGVFSVISSHPQSGTDVDNNTCIPRLSDASEDSAAILREKYSPSAGTKELPSIAKRELCLPDSGMDDTVYIANTKIPVDGWIQACRCRRQGSARVDQEESCGSKDSQHSSSLIPRACQALPGSQSLSERQQFCQAALQHVEDRWAGLAT